MSNSNPQRDLLLAFYSDDFTGATDALECLATAGVPTTVFLRPPSRAELAALTDATAIGVAGRSRSLPTTQLANEVRSALEALRELGPRYVHYKVCSTFDSSPSMGSIGRVIDEAAHVFDAPFVPLVVGAPALGRWCVFGNLFAQQGIGDDGEVFRLDRHPTMRHHPVTPADESDLRRHLARQTARSVELFDVRQVELPLDDAAAALHRLLERQPDVVLFDVLHERHLATIGALVDRYAHPSRPLFAVGSSGFEMALTAHWATTGQRPPQVVWPRIDTAGPIVVASGSCSPVTAAQIDDALARGFGNVPLDTIRILDGQGIDVLVAEAVERASLHLAAGRSVVVHTSRGPDDLRLTRGTDARQSSSAEVLGAVLGRVVVGCIGRRPVRRVCVAGGDTSSYVARELDVGTLEMVAPLARGAPLCRVKSALPAVDGLEIVFKGGQVGRPDFFAMVAEGGT